MKAKSWVIRMIIYKATNIINNKVYIGQTIHPLSVRKSQHERSHEYGYKTAFSNAIRKYGKENFKWEVIYEADAIEELNPTSKKVINITTNMIFGSASEAARYDKANFSHVCAVCRGLRGSTKGNVYRYLDEDNRIIEPENAASVKAKKVKNIDTGEIFENAIIAEFHYQGYKSGNLSKDCTGKNKTFAGFRWQYI